MRETAHDRLRKRAKEWASMLYADDSVPDPVKTDSLRQLAEHVELLLQRHREESSRRTAQTAR